MRHPSKKSQTKTKKRDVKKCKQANALIKRDKSFLVQIKLRDTSGRVDTMLTIIFCC